MSTLRQLEELQLISCSFLPGETFSFSEDCESWSRTLEIYATNPEEAQLVEERSNPCFHVGLEVSKSVEFELELPRGYPENGLRPIVAVRLQGEYATRTEQEKWKQIIEDKLNEVMAEHGDSGYPVYELLSAHLMPLLHANAEKAVQKAAPADEDSSRSPATPTRYHALFTSHHLVSPTKRRNLQGWSSSLSISGFAKVGYPGVIYAQGTKDNVEEFVENVKAMQWLALRLRFLEAVEDDDCPKSSDNRWKEFQKVGEVVEEMRRIGREKYVVEMGIGSAGST